MNKSDLYILAVFARLGGTDEMKALKITEIAKAIKDKYSHTKIRETTKILKSIDVLKEGLKHGNSKTYFITRKGFQLLDELDINYMEDDLKW